MDDEKLLNEFKNWYLRFQKKYKNWPSGITEECEVMFFSTCNKFKILLKKTERAIDSKIDKEIRTKKQDRPTLLKAKRLSKGKNVESKYIDLRFEEEWDDASENVLAPFLATAMRAISLHTNKKI